MTAAGRTVLLLQGPRSSFFARLADALAARGAGVRRVLFCPGDALFWRGRPAIRWRDPPEAWPAGARRLLTETGATDVAGLGDGRFWHAEAFAAAREAGVAVHVIEQGYLRPGWLTVEPDALGAWRPSAADLARGGPPPETPPPPRASFAAWAAMDVAWDLANLAVGRWTYPHFRTHALDHPAREWAGYARAWAARRLGGAARARTLAAIRDGAGPVFLVALQLESDFMIRRAGPPGGLRAAFAALCADFAAHAPAGARLAVKPHPLDPGLAPWRRIAAEALGPRALWLDGGDLAALHPHLAGVVTANSTAGLAALRDGVPVALLGRAVYEDLAWRGPLAGFWRAPPRPDPARVAAFLRALAAATQVPGHFDGPRMAAGAEAVADRILARPAPGARVRPLRGAA